MVGPRFLGASVQPLCLNLTYSPLLLSHSLSVCLSLSLSIYIYIYVCVYIRNVYSQASYYAYVTEANTHIGIYIRYNYTWYVRMIVDSYPHSLKWLGRLFGPEKGEDTEVFLGL